MHGAHGQEAPALDSGRRAGFSLLTCLSYLFARRYAREDADPPLAPGPKTTRFAINPNKSADSVALQLDVCIRAVRRSSFNIWALIRRAAQPCFPGPKKSPLPPLGKKTAPHGVPSAYLAHLR